MTVPESVEAKLYAALLEFCDEYSIELDRGAMADLCIPAGVSVQFRVPIAALAAAQ